MEPSTHPTTGPTSDPATDAALVLTTCPACGHPAQVEWRTVLESTDGPVEHARIVCLNRHWFLLPVEWLRRQP